MKKILLILSLLFLVFPKIIAGDRTEQQMKEAAAKVLNSGSRRAAGNSELKEFQSLSKLRIYGYDEGGFAVVTTDDRFNEVIGYSSSKFSENIPCGFKWWMEGVEEIMESYNGQTMVIQRRANNRASRVSIAPLMTTIWGQERPFNDNCTFSNNGSTYQCVTGCVATALAQVMNYYKYPEHGNESNSYNITYNDKFTITFSEDFSQSYYDWGNMLDNYNSYKNTNTKDSHTRAVAKLMKDCGVATTTNYSDNTHGSSSSLRRVEDALKTYFYYDESTKYYSRSNYGKNEWMDIIYNEIYNGRPVLYCGAKSESINSVGHAFVLNGYDSSGNVYINWGWEGSCDGYFDIDLLNPNNENYNYVQGMVVTKPGNNSVTSRFYSFNISAQGSGSVYYGSMDGAQIKGGSQSFNVKEGNRIVLFFAPDSGNIIKSVKINGKDVTSSILDNSYTINSINQDTNVEVEFEVGQSDIDITQYISVASIGGSISQTNNLIKSGSKLKWSFSNNSSKSVTLNSLQLIDGETGNAGNIMAANAVVDANTSVSYSTTIGSAGIHIPVTCRFRYTYNNIVYSTDAVYTGTTTTGYTLSIKASGNGQVSYKGNSIRNTTKTYSVDMLATATLTITPDNGYQIKSVKLNGTDVTSRVSNNSYTIDWIISNQSVEVEFEAIPPTTYTLSITASGNGSASYNSTTIRGKTTSFTVNEGTSAKITFSPDNGYRIKNVKVNGSTVSVSNNQYTISSINANTTVSVEFEAIPPTTYTLSITASGNGSASYNSTTIRGKTTSFTVNEGTSAKITFSPDNGYRIKSVKVNGSTVSVTNNQYTISSINANTTVSVEFEAIPPTTYTLSITASGNGSASYNSTTIRGKTTSFTVNEGTSAKITFSPDNGYRIKNVKVNGSTVSVSNNQYTISSINANTTVGVEFEAIPPTTYTLSITASGNGSASYNSTTIRSKTTSFTVNEGISAKITFLPDNGYRIKNVKVNGSTVSVSNNQYTISSINANTTVSVEFEAVESDFDITQYVSASNIGGSIMQTNNLITSGSKLNWSFSNKSTKSVTLNSMQLIDGETGNAGNIMAVNAVVDANTSVSYSTTIGAAGIHIPVTCRFRYTYNGIEYSTDAVYSGTQGYTLSIKASGNGQVSYKGNSIRNTTKTYSVDMLATATLTITPDNGYQIKSVKLNGTDVTSRVSNNSYTIDWITSNQSVEVEFEAIPPTTYTLSIIASGNGSASYNSTTIRGKTTSFTVNEGTSAKITFSPDNGYRIKSVKVNGSTVSVSNNQYTISSINANTTVSVEFEAITYTLSITASGNGSASYNSTTIRGKTTSFTVNEGTSAKITFSPDNGYRIKSVKVNGSTVSVSNNQYTISSINANTTVSVEFEAIPPTTYTLSIIASGNGSASYNSTTIRGKTTSFTVNEGTSAKITFSPDNGHRIKSVKVNGATVSVSNNQYTISSINANTTVSVEFEAIPPTTYTLSITASGNGSASYNSTTIRGKTTSFTMNEGTFAKITFSPDNGYRIKNVKVNGSTVSISNNQYTISSINANTTVSVEFEAIPPTTYNLTYIVDGIVYKTVTYEYGAKITPEAEPTKEGYTFSGWSWIPSKMPAEDVIVTGTFTINKYKLIYKVDGEVYRTYEIGYGTNITPEAKPTKEGHTFSGWSWIPSKMPAEDVTITGTFTVNKYKLTYVIDGEVFMTEEVEYGSRITPPNPGDREGYDFAWGDYPDTMPAKDIIISGSYTTGIAAILASGKSFDIYSLTGRLLKRQTTSFDGLPSGFYIVNGMKLYYSKKIVY